MIFALVLLGLSVVASTVILMVTTSSRPYRISFCLVVACVIFLIQSYWVGQGAR
jgi:hypothetical protein